MTNPYYNFTTPLTRDTLARAEVLNSQLQAVSDGFDLIPDIEAFNQGRTIYATSSGTGSAYTLTLTPAPDSYIEGLTIRFKAPASNTGAVTVNVNALGVKALVRNNGAALVSGDIQNGSILQITYDGTSFRVVTIILADITAAATSATAAAGSASAAASSASSASTSASSAASSLASINAAFSISGGKVGVNKPAGTEQFEVGVAPSGTADDGMTVVDTATLRALSLSRTGSSYNYAGVSGACSIVYSSDALAFISDITGSSSSIFFSTGNQIAMSMGDSGTVYLPRIGTTASAANAFLDAGSTPANQILRSTSSARYKTDIHDVDLDYASRIYRLRPVYYRSKAEADRKDWSWYGLIAEEVAEIEPRLVHWVKDENGDSVPDGVQYDRLNVLLLKVIQDLESRIKALENRA